MSEPSVTKNGRNVFWWNSAVLSDFSTQYFNVDWLRSRGKLCGSAQGRGQAHFIDINGKKLVLRKYVRGGMIRLVSSRSFFRLGALHSRAYREYCLLEWMRNLDLPVPRPVAARYAPTGLFYRASLITELIPETCSLAEAVQTAALPEEVWYKVGVSVHRIHAAGVDHVDLNCRNILLDGAGQVWIIDFDRCRHRAMAGWTSANLDRLKRSLVKESLKQDRFFWTDKDWSALLRGYHSGGSKR